MASTNTSSSSSFEAFNCLPPELRLRIWSFALPRSRIISLSLIQYSRTIYEINSSLPVLLYVTHESRAVALTRYKQYVLWVDSDSHKPMKADDGPKIYQRVWLNLDTDIVFFTSDALLIPRFRIRKLELDNGRCPKEGYGKGKECGREQLTKEKGDNREEQKVLDKITHIAIRFEALCADISGYMCGIGHMRAMQDHHDRIQTIKAALEVLPSLQNLYIVVDELAEKEKDKKRKNREEDRARRLARAKIVEEAREKKLKGSKENVEARKVTKVEKQNKDEPEQQLPEIADKTKGPEFVEFEISERFTKERYEEIHSVVKRQFEPSGYQGLEFFNKLSIMELRSKEEIDFMWKQDEDQEALKRIKRKAVLGADSAADSNWENLHLGSFGKY